VFGASPDLVHVFDGRHIDPADSSLLPESNPPAAQRASLRRRQCKQPDPLALVRAVGLGASDDLLAHLPAQRQPGADIKLRVNERVEG
jgi:hypothetical protein